MGFEAAFGAFGFNVQTGLLFAGFGEVCFERVENFLGALAFGVFVMRLNGGVFEFRGGDLERGGRFGGFLF